MNTKHNNLTTDSAFTSAFQEVLGEIGQDSSAEQPATGKSSDRLITLCNRLAAQYDPACACGLAQQVGRSAFTHVLRKNNGLTDQSVRLLPGHLRLMQGFNRLETLIKNIFEIPVTVVDAADTIQVKTKDESARHNLIPYLAAGFIQEFVHWLSGGKPHPVMVAGGQPDWSVIVGKQPLDS